MPTGFCIPYGSYWTTISELSSCDETGIPKPPKLSVCPLTVQFINPFFEKHIIIICFWGKVSLHSLAWNPQRSAYHCFPSARIKDVFHNVWHLAESHTVDKQGEKAFYGFFNFYHFGNSSFFFWKCVVCVQRPESMSVTFLNCSPLYFLRQGLSLTLELADYLASKTHGSPCLCLPLRAGISGACQHIYVGARESNSVPNTAIVSHPISFCRAKFLPSMDFCLDKFLRISFFFFFFF